MTLSCLEMQKMPRVFVMHTETEILQKKKSVPVQAGFLNCSVSWHIFVLHQGVIVKISLSY